MDAIPKLKILNRDVVEVLIEVLHADNLIAKWFRAVRVFLCAGSGRGRLWRRLLLTLLGPKLPAVLELGDAHRFEDGIQHGGAACGRCRRGGLRAACSGQVRGGEGRKTAGHFSGEKSLDSDVVEGADNVVEMRLKLLAEGRNGRGRERLALGNRLEALKEGVGNCALGIVGLTLLNGDNRGVVQRI